MASGFFRPFLSGVRGDSGAPWRCGRCTFFLVGVQHLRHARKQTLKTIHRTRGRRALLLLLIDLLSKQLVRPQQCNREHVREIVKWTVLKTRLIKYLWLAA